MVVEAALVWPGPPGRLETLLVDEVRECRDAGVDVDMLAFRCKYEAGAAEPDESVSVLLRVNGLLSDVFWSRVIVGRGGGRIAPELLLAAPFREMLALLDSCDEVEVGVGGLTGNRLVNSLPLRAVN